MKLETKAIWLIFSLLVPPTSLAQGDPTAPLGFNSSDSRPKAKTKARVRTPNLEAILCGEQEGCTAVLNGRVINQGQSINGYVITKINENNVIVKRGDRHWSLVLFNEQVIQ